MSADGAPRSEDAARLDANRMAIAAAAAHERWGTTRPNPTVGAAVFDDAGELIAVGVTEPPGGRHAEVVALDAAGDRAAGGTVVVTLEPCNHTGRTGPCTERIIAAGLARVVFAAHDPNPLASGGAERLAAAGLDVRGGVGLTPDAAIPGAAGVLAGPLGPWLFRQQHGRPRVTWKYAASMDGRSAASDGTSQWITGPAARAHTLERRSRYEAIVVGSGTVAADDPSLTARGAGGERLDRQPLRCAMGESEVPPGARIRGDGDGLFAHLRTRDPHAAIRSLDERLGRPAEEVLLEGGPRLAGAFLRAGLVDRVEAYIAPVFLGAGSAALGDAGVGTIDDARRFTIEYVEAVGTDLFAELVPAETVPG